uniref:Uncharacterized protein n=1 Tax=Aegilops tauschii subsp. strangulata TaxID=200361 RepID=A0A452ZHB0_AEGTS
MRTGEIELLLKSGARRREVAFNMVDCDFKVFEGKWSVQEGCKPCRLWVPFPAGSRAESFKRVQIMWLLLD